MPEADGKSFRMTLFMQNIDAAVPLYVMLNAVGVYVQSGMSWQQVPSSPRSAAWALSSWSTAIPTTVLHARGGELGRADPRLHACAHPGRHADQPQAQPGTTIAERRTPYYVYLKPHGADDADIKARSHMSGTPPVFIPMPPH